MRALLAIPLLLAVVAGCLSDRAPEADVSGFAADPSFENPAPAAVTGFEFVAQLADGNGTPFPSAGGNFVFGDYVFSSGLNAGFFVSDISDPEHPVLLYNTTADSPTPFSRKADIVAHPDGRRTLVLATQANGMHFWDVTDPSAPIFAAVLEFEANHNIAVVPGTELVFNNPSTGARGSNALIDASNPYDPRILGDFGTHGCHGTTFHGRLGDADFRAYCAAIQRTEIWDLSGLDLSLRDFNITVLGAVSDLDSPVTGSPVANPQIPSNPFGIGSTPVRNLHHFATASNDGSVLIIGDEHRGGGNPGACYAYNDQTGASTPFGALWFYDISNPADPVMLSWISPETVLPHEPTVPGTVPEDPTAVPLTAAGTAYSAVPNCTAHFGTVIPGEDKIVIAWYSAGVLLIDFTDPAAPRILDQYQPENVNVWNARVWNGYVFTGDINRGMDVLRLV